MKKIITFEVVDHVEEIMIPYKKTIYKNIEKEVDACDICGQAKQGIPICLGCGKVICYLCNRTGIMDQKQLWVGTQEEGDCHNFIPQSDDFDTEHFYLCKECEQSPPEKIKFINKWKFIDELENDIKKITQEMIKDVRLIRQSDRL